MTTYTTPGPHIEGRVVNLDVPDAATSPTEITVAFAQYDRLISENPAARYEVQRRTVFVDPWERA